MSNRSIVQKSSMRSCSEDHTHMRVEVNTWRWNSIHFPVSSISKCVYFQVTTQLLISSVISLRAIPQRRVADEQDSIQEVKQWTKHLVDRFNSPMPVGCCTQAEPFRISEGKNWPSSAGNNHNNNCLNKWKTFTMISASSRFVWPIRLGIAVML